VTHFRHQFLPLLRIENLHPKHEIIFLVCNIVVNMKTLGMPLVESLMMSQKFVMDHPHNLKIVDQKNHHKNGMDPLQR